MSLVIFTEHETDSLSSEFSLSSSAREGGVMVLPDGAIREDLETGPELFEYIEKHVVDWYQHLVSGNNTPASVAVNASAYLITGCDRARSCSSITIPGNAEDAASIVQMDYDHRKSPPWISKDRKSTREYAVERSETEERFYSVFLRGFRLALNNHVFLAEVKYTPPEEHYYYNLLTTPILGREARFIRKREQWFGRKEPVLGNSRPQVRPTTIRINHRKT